MSFIKIGLQVFLHTHYTLYYKEAWLGKRTSVDSLYPADSEKEKTGDFQLVSLYQVPSKRLNQLLSILLLSSTLTFIRSNLGNFLFGKFSAGFVLLNSRYF